MLYDIRAWGRDVIRYGIMERHSRWRIASKIRGFGV